MPFELISQYTTAHKLHNTYVERQKKSLASQTSFGQPSSLANILLDDGPDIIKLAAKYLHMQYKNKYLHMTHWCNSELTMTAVWCKWVKCFSETHKASFSLIQLQLVWRQKSEQEPVKDSKELVF